MPTFPTYRGELPPCLHPLNLGHYFWLAYWVCFRPTALKCYLYQADPELYWAMSDLNIFNSLRLPAYRNLYLMVPGVNLLLLALVSLPVVLAISWIQNTSVSFLDIAWSAVGVAVMGVFVVILTLINITLGGVNVASSVTLGVTLSVALGIVDGIADDVASGAAFGVAFGVAFSAFKEVGFLYAFKKVSVAFGVAVGAFSIAVGVLFGFLDSIAVGVALIIGTLRLLPFYPLQLVLALRSRFRGKHPVEWDELVILPLPGTQQLLTRRLQQNEKRGLRLVVDVLRNTFQGHYAQRALQAYLHSHSAPLHFFYTLVTCPDMNEYFFVPDIKRDLRLAPTNRAVLLNQLSGWGASLILSDEKLLSSVGLVWRLTWRRRDRRLTPLTQFAGMLDELLLQKKFPSEDFDLFPYRQIYDRLTDYPGGVEIANSFDAMAIFLSYNHLSALPAAAKVVEKLQLHRISLETAIRPTVITALTRLKEIGAEIATYQDATTRANKQAALLRATDALDKLDEYVVAEVVAPEQTILRRLLGQWRKLVSEAGGEEGRAQISGPVPNPYIAGNPVIGDLFVGREDIMGELEELWTKPGQCPSVVLYGHRRMGKSSILQNLGDRFGAQTVIIDFNMQRVGNIASTGELFHALALELYDSLPPAGQQELGEPQEESFTTRNPYNTLNRFLKQLDGLRGEGRFIITLDEFELLEEKIEQQRLEPNLLDYWRGLIHTYPWWIMAFAGLHNLEEMRRDYWHPLYSSVKAIPVSFLSPKAALRLITQPSPDFDIDYDPEAIERIINLTNGQAYLIQHICHALVTRFNRQTFEEGREGKRRFTLEDVETVINAPEFYRDGNAYFHGVWDQAEKSQPEGQLKILEKLSSAEMSLPELVEETALTEQQVLQALTALKNHDVIEQRGDNFVYRVKLMRRWVARRTARL